MNNIVKQKLAFVGHILRGFNGLNVLLLLEEKFKEKKARGSTRRTLIDDVL